MKRILLALPLLLIAGCGDPENDRLSTGDHVIAFKHHYGDASLDRSDHVYLDESGDAFWPRLPYGTHLSVVTDNAEPERTWSTRKVMVHVEDGPHQGKTGILTRWSLRKVK